MAVDLGDLVEPLQAEVSPPGSNLFPESTDDDWIIRLQNGFWTARLDGILSGYTEEDGEITTDNGGADMPRDLQQVVVLYAAYNTLLNQIRSQGTKFRAKAGPVEYETQNSATMFNALLEEISNRRNILISQLGALGIIPSYYIDNVIARSASIGYGTTWFIGN